MHEPARPGEPSPRETTIGLRACRHVGLGLVACVLAARTMFPSEDADSGAGIVFVLLELTCGVLLFLEWALGGSGCRPGIPGALWLLLLAAVWLSAARANYQFPAGIMAWELSGIAAAWFYLRHQAARWGPTAVATVTLSMLLAQSGFALKQVVSDFPELRDHFRRGDPAVTNELRNMGIEPGTPAEAAFRSRLLDSREPYGSFGLPNSLAGYLLLGSPLLLVTAWRVWTASFSIVLRTIAASGTILALCALVLTKSRSAWIGLVVAIVVLVGRGGQVRSAIARHSRWFVLLAGTISIVVAGAWMTGGLDRQVISEAGKSFSYRWEWWQAAVPIIGENPWLGVGFGSFRDAYLRHKLPFSSEEIKDPHNFVLELWCCAGLVAAIAYLALLVVSVRDGIKNSTSGDSQQEWVSPVADGVARPACIIGILSAAFLVWWLELPGSIDWFGMTILLLATWTLSRNGASMLISCDVRRAMIAGVVGLHVNWLASGGLSYPGLMLPCWAMCALFVPERRGCDAWRPRVGVQYLLAGLACVIAWLFLERVYFPLVARDQTMRLLRNLQGEESIAAVEAAQKTADRVPEDLEGWVRLASLHARRMQAKKADDRLFDYRQALRNWEKALALAPMRNSTWRDLAATHWRAYELGIDPDGRDRAIAAWKRVVAGYPNSAVRRWELANALQHVSRHDEAVAEFSKALELDQTPHPDKKLSESQRAAAKQYTGQ